MKKSRTSLTPDISHLKRTHIIKVVRNLMTHQIPDKLIYNNQEYFLKDQLLESYFKEFPGKKPEKKLVESCIWRGYIATLEIINNELFIREIELLLNSDYDSKSIIDNIFPRNKKFDWYSGLIYLDSTEKKYKNNSAENVFEYLEIRNGNLIKKRVMNSEELETFKKIQFEYFILSDDVKPVYELFKKKNEGISNEKINDIIKESILYYTKEVYVE